MTTVELMASPEWEAIRAEIDRVAKIEHIVAIPHGMVEFHGVSELFTVTPIEGATPKYDCFFKTVDSKPVFDKFIPV